MSTLHNRVNELLRTLGDTGPKVAAELERLGYRPTQVGLEWYLNQQLSGGDRLGTGVELYHRLVPQLTPFLEVWDPDTEQTSEMDLPPAVLEFLANSV